MILLVFATGSLHSEGLDDYRIGPEARFSVITVADGPELYASFGHSVVRVQDPQYGIDWAVDWGNFNYEAQGFYINFIRGRLDYMMAVTRFANFYRRYEIRDLTMIEQELDLSPQEKEQFFAFIQETYKPENRTYAYDFFKDNCATRIGEYLLTQFPDTIRFKEPYEPAGTSYQAMLQPHLQVKPWTGMGMNIVLGSEANKEILNHNRMFLPEDLYKALGEGEILKEGRWQPLVTEERVIYESRGTRSLSVPPFYRQPWLYTSLLMLFGWAQLFWFHPRGVAFPRLRKFTNILLGGLTIFLTFMWLGTDHSATEANLNILWTIPWGALAAGLQFNRHKKLRWGLVVTLSLIWLLFILRTLFTTAVVNPALIPLLVYIWSHNIQIIAFDFSAGDNE